MKIIPRKDPVHIIHRKYRGAEHEEFSEQCWCSPTVLRGDEIMEKTHEDLIKLSRARPN